LAAGALLLPYPFLPRHLTIIDSLAIGIPCFFLALAPNSRRFIPGFVTRVLRFAVPAGVTIAAATFATFATAHEQGIPLVQQRTAATIVTLALSLYLLALVAWPLKRWRLLLMLTLGAGFVALFPVEAFRKFFALELPHGLLAVTIWCVAGGAVLLTLLWLMVHRAPSPGDRADLRAGPAFSPPVNPDHHPTKDPGR
jgi:cation-transporting ATPase E